MIRFLHGSSPDSINLVRKCYLEYSSDMHCMRGIWKGKIWEILPRRLNAKEVVTSKKDWKFSYSRLQSTRQKYLEVIMKFEKSTLWRSQQRTSKKLGWKETHVEFRVQLYVSKEETSPNPLKYTDVTRSSHTNLDVIPTIIGMLMVIERWQILEQDLRSSSYYMRNILQDIRVPGGRLTKIRALSRPAYLRPGIWMDMSKAAEKQEKYRWTFENTKLERHLFHRHACLEVNGNCSKWEY